jgi:hypothetical protein
MLDSVFLKKPRRIASLMMVMTLCLMVSPERGPEGRPGNATQSEG